LTSAAVGLFATLSNAAKSSEVKYEDDVAVLTDSNFTETVLNDEKGIWFIKFYAPWCGHCKNMAPAWAELGKAMKGKVNIGKLDATSETATQNKFGISSYPQIKLLPTGPKSVSMAVDYEEGRDFSAMQNFALKYFQMTVEAEQLVSQAMMDEKCGSQLCVIAHLPHIIDSKKEGRKKYLDDYNTAARGSGGVPVTYLWSQGGDQYEFEEKLNLGFGYPALIAIHLKKQKYSIHRGSFDLEGVRSFVTSLTGGRAALHDIPANLPKIQKADPWDGEDFKEEL